MTHPGGRPLKFQSVKELQEKIDAYFADCDSHVEEITEWIPKRDTSGKLLTDENGEHYLIEITHMVKTPQIPYTITGLALALDTSRETLINYEDRPEFFDTIKRAKEKVENYLELNLNSTSPTGTIFNLKNNFGWKDKTEQEIDMHDSRNPFANADPKKLEQMLNGTKPKRTTGDKSGTSKQSKKS